MLGLVLQDLDVMDKRKWLYWTCSISYYLTCANDVVKTSNATPERSSWLMSVVLTFFLANGGFLLWRVLNAGGPLAALEDLPLIVLCWFAVYRFQWIQKTLETFFVRGVVGMFAALIVCVGMMEEMEDVLEERPKALFAAIIAGGMTGAAGIFYSNLEESFSGKKRLSALGLPPVSLKRAFIFSAIYAYLLNAYRQDHEFPIFLAALYLKVAFCAHAGIESFLDRELDIFAPIEFILKGVLGMDVSPYKRWYMPTSTTPSRSGAEFAYWNKRR